MRRFMFQQLYGLLLHMFASVASFRVKSVHCL